MGRRSLCTSGLSGGPLDRQNSVTIRRGAAPGLQVTSAVPHRDLPRALLEQGGQEQLSR